MKTEKEKSPGHRYGVTVMYNKETYDKLVEMSKVLNCSKSELIRSLVITAHKGYMSAVEKEKEENGTN